MMERNEKFCAVNLRKLSAYMLALAVVSLAGCSSPSFEVLNPYGDEPVPYGQRDSKALKEEVGFDEGGASESSRARDSLEAIASYRKAQEPQPTYPVVQPAEVRLMWVPDHLTRTGDLVPAHYYYLRVLDDRWAVTDAFDLERQLNAGSSSGSSGTPWVPGK